MLHAFSTINPFQYTTPRGQLLLWIFLIGCGVLLLICAASYLTRHLKNRRSR